MATAHNAPTDSITKEEKFSIVKDIQSNSAVGQTLMEWMELTPNRSVIASTEMESPTKDDTSLNVRFSPAMPMHINCEESMDLTFAQIKPRRVLPAATITRTDDDENPLLDELKKFRQVPATKPALADDDIVILSRSPSQESIDKVPAVASSFGVQLRETAVFHAENSESLRSYDERTTSAEASLTGQSTGPVTNAIKPPQSASLTGQEIGPVMNAIKTQQSRSANTMKRKYGQSVGIQSMIVEGTVLKKAKQVESKLKVPTLMVSQSKPSTSKTALKSNVQLNTVPARMIGNAKKGKSVAPAQVASHSATSKTGVTASTSSDIANMKRKNVANIPLNHPNVGTTRETGIPKQQQKVHQLRELKQNYPGITIKPVGGATYDPVLYNYIKILERNGVTVKKVNVKKSNIDRM